MAKTDLTAARLRELLDYNPDTGVFLWRISRSNVYAGSVAGTKTKHGYLRISVDGTGIRAHRLAWIYCNGSWPEHLIDHINGDKSDNRINNLRCVTHSENVQNQRSAHSNSKSNILGVSLKKNGRWAAQISVNKKVMHLGVFNTAELAHAAYLYAKKSLHFSNEISANAVDRPKRFRNPLPGSASGIAGVHWSKQCNKWLSRITVNGERKYLGLFGTAQEAHDAYKNAQKEFGLS